MQEGMLLRYHMTRVDTYSFSPTQPVGQPWARGLLPAFPSLGALARACLQLIPLWAILSRLLYASIS